MAIDAGINDDCWPCRLISGFSVIGIGTYIFAQAKKRKPIEANIMKLLSAGTIGLGVARLLNMKFLKSNKDNK